MKTQSNMKTVTLNITCDGAGAALVNGPGPILGFIYSILYKPGTIANGATLTVTAQGNIAQPLMTKANAGIADVMFYPRDLEHAVADGAANGGTGIPLVNGVPRVVIAAGGAGGVGSLVIYYFD